MISWREYQTFLLHFFLSCFIQLLFNFSLRALEVFRKNPFLFFLLFLLYIASRTDELYLYFTRSFGDFLLKSEMDKPPWKQVTAENWKTRNEAMIQLTICPQVISPVPQIEQFKIDTSWEFLIVATDGVSMRSLSLFQWTWWHSVVFPLGSDLILSDLVNYCGNYWRYGMLCPTLRLSTLWNQN